MFNVVRHHINGGQRFQMENRSTLVFVDILITLFTKITIVC